MFTTSHLSPQATDTFCRCSPSSLQLLAQYRWILPVDNHSVDRDHLTFDSISDCVCFNVVQSQIYVSLGVPWGEFWAWIIKTAAVNLRLQHDANLTYKLAHSFLVNYKDTKVLGIRIPAAKPSIIRQGGRRRAGKDSRHWGEEDGWMNDINSEVRGHTLTVS